MQTYEVPEDVCETIKLYTSGVVNVDYDDISHFQPI